MELTQPVAYQNYFVFPTEHLGTQVLNLCESPFHPRPLLSQVRKLKMQLEEERQKYSRSDGMNPDIMGLENGSDLQLIEMQSRYMAAVQRCSLGRANTLISFPLSGSSRIVSEYIVEQLFFFWYISLQETSHYEIP